MKTRVVQRKRPFCTCPHQISPLPVSCPRDRPHGQSPSTNPVHRTPVKDSHPEPPIDHTLTPTRTRISSPLTIARAQRPWCTPQRNVTYVIRESCPHHQCVKLMITPVVGLGDLSLGFLFSHMTFRMCLLEKQNGNTWGFSISSCGPQSFSLLGMLGISADILLS